MTDLLVRRSAEIDGDYRFSLTRVWDERCELAFWLMLNPSTADAGRDDPTIRRVMHFSRANGAGGCVVFNLWPLRTAYPRELWPAISRISRQVTERNLMVILNASSRQGLRIAAFGADAGRRRYGHVVQTLRAFEAVAPKDRAFKALGETSDGWPLHPLARGKSAIPNTRKLGGWSAPRGHDAEDWNLK